MIVIENFFLFFYLSFLHEKVSRRREEKRLADLEMSRKNAELAALAREEKEKAEALQGNLGNESNN